MGLGSGGVHDPLDPRPFHEVGGASKESQAPEAPRPLHEISGSVYTEPTPPTPHVKTLKDLKEYFIACLGEVEGTKMYNQFITTTIILPTMQQMQKDEKRLEEAEKKMSSDQP